jgi:putative resolvase
MPVPPRRRPWGTIVVEVSVGEVSGRTVVVYVRVFSDQWPDLEAQAGRVTTWCARHAVRVGEVVTEVGSGVNVRRPQLARLLSTPRSGRWWSRTPTGWPVSGPSTWRAVLAGHGRRVVVVESSPVHG